MVEAERVGNIAIEIRQSEVKNGAGGGIRTRDPNLGKVVLYQLSYTRNKQISCTIFDLGNYNKVGFSCQLKSTFYQSFHFT